MKQLILDYTPYCTRAAIVDDGILLDFSVERANFRGIVGNIYKGKVENVIGGMQAAFVNIGEERNGFLFTGDSLVDSRELEHDMPKGKPFNVSAGDVIMCQVVKEPLGQKGARLTTDVTIPGYYLVLLPLSPFAGVSRKIDDGKRRAYLEEYVSSICPEGMGYIVRTAAKKASDEDLANEMQTLLERWEQIRKDYANAKECSLVFEEASLFERAVRDTMYEDVDSIVVNDKLIAKQLAGKVGKPIETYENEINIMSFYGVSEQINHLCDRKVVMPSGAYLVIDKTEALTVIDVNTGKFVGTSHLEDTVYKTNLAAAECIASQLRLRNISGIVIIDFIDMTMEEHRQNVLETLKEALKPDRMKTSTVGFTSLGLVELTRKKTRAPLDEFMLQPCKDCPGGFVISDSQLAFMLRDDLVNFIIENKCETVYVGAHEDVFNMVFESGLMNRKLENDWKDKQIYFYVDDDLTREQWNISQNKPEGHKGYVRVLKLINN